MGDPRKIKKKFAGPRHPWIKEAIDSEKILKKEFALKNKQEMFIAASQLKRFKDTAKKLLADKSAQGEKEKQHLAEKVKNYGLLPVGASIDSVLSLQLKDILGRRIQSLVFRRGLARSMKQARQFITHRHIRIGDKEITSPSTLLTQEEESKLTFKNSSNLAKEDHPERINLAAQEIHAEAEAVKAVPKVEKKNEAKEAIKKVEAKEAAP